MLHQWSVFQTVSKTWRPWVSTWTNWPKYETKAVVKVAQHSKSWKSYAGCAYQYSLATREMAYMGALACALEGRAKRESNNGRSVASASHFSAPELFSSFICCWLKNKIIYIQEYMWYCSLLSRLQPFAAFSWSNLNYFKNRLHAKRPSRPQN